MTANRLRAPCVRLILVLALASPSVTAHAAVYYVDDVAGSGNGSRTAPFNIIQDGIDAARPGDIVRVLPGEYVVTDYRPTYRKEAVCALRSVRDGAVGRPITITAYDPNNRPVIKMGIMDVTQLGRPYHLNDKSFMAYINHKHITLDWLIIDGQYAHYVLVLLNREAHNTTVRNCLIKHGKRDGLKLLGVFDALIENCEIHHMLRGTAKTPRDAHGIMACQQQNLVIRDCSIHHVSGDCIQTDPLGNHGFTETNGEWFADRRPWDNVLVENCRLWTGPVGAGVQGWPSDVSPGENAIDTKTNPHYTKDPSYRAKIAVRGGEVYGFMPTNKKDREAFNVKHKVAWLIENVIVHDNAIAFRVRGRHDNYYIPNLPQGSARLLMRNVVAYNNDITLRLERDLEEVRIYNCTFDNKDLIFSKEYKTRYIAAADGYGPGVGIFEMLNCAFTGQKPLPYAGDASNCGVDATDFVDEPHHDYHLSRNSPLIDAGVDVASVRTDLEGKLRPLGGYDIGAYE